MNPSAIFVTRHSLSAVFSYKRSGSALSGLVYILHFLNLQFLDKGCHVNEWCFFNIILSISHSSIYNYSNIL